MIGDPSGKDKERPLLTSEQVKSNIKRITKTIEFCLDFSSEKTKPIIVNNSSWYDSMSMVSFFKRYWKTFLDWVLCLERKALKQGLIQKRG